MAYFSSEFEKQQQQKKKVWIKIQFLGGNEKI